jgi:hypothetical protein
MAEKYTDRIKDYCDSEGVEIPSGFYRHPASRYAVIDLEATPFKLVARTWFQQQDVVYYLQSLAAGKPVKILDFKDRQQLVLENGQRLKPTAAF